MPRLSDSLSFTNRNVPVGVVVSFGFGTLPEGYLDCNGAAVSRTTYKALFDTIGTAFGVGDGSTTFNVPDMRGIFPRGTGRPLVGGVTYDGSTLGTKVKDKTNNTGLSASTTSSNSASVSSNNDSHTHSFSDRYLSAPLQRSYLDSTGDPVAVSYTNSEVGRTTGNPNVSLNHTHSVATNTVSSTSTLSSSQSETVPGYLTVKYGIKA